MIFVHDNTKVQNSRGYPYGPHEFAAMSFCRRREEVKLGPWSKGSRGRPRGKAKNCTHTLGPFQPVCHDSFDEEFDALSNGGLVNYQHKNVQENKNYEYQ